MSTPPAILSQGPLIEDARLTPARRREAYLHRRVARRERARLRAEERGPVRISLWLPTTLIFALLAPFALGLSPFLLLVTPRYRLAWPQTVFAVGAVLLSLSGTHVEVDAPECRIRIHLF